MIKPFKILRSEHIEADRVTNVLYEVSKTSRSGDKGFTTNTMQTMIAVPDGEDIDLYIFKALEANGWI